MATEWSIEVSHLSKSFDGLLAVSDLNFRVAKGEIYGFLGPNGSGKTTTMRLLCGLLKPDSGEGYCLGYNIRTQAYAIRPLIGYMAQRFSLYADLSVYENLQFMAKVYGVDNSNVRIQHTLERFHLADRKDQLAGHLSGGWKQRLTLAAVLLHEPKLLLLDEPTAGIDLAARREFWSQIQELTQHGISALVSTHYTDEANRCDHLAYVSRGHVLIKGTPTDVIKETNIQVFELSDGDLVGMLAQLRQHLPEELAVILNQRLRIIVDDPELWQQILQQHQWQQLAWDNIQPTLEDVFVYLKQKRQAYAEV